MKASELKNPGTYSGGQNLRARVAHAISFAETVTRYRSDPETVSPTAAALAAFLKDAAEKTPGYTAAGSATVTKAGTVAVRNSAGADSHNATAVVTGTTLTGVNLASTAAIVDNADTTTVRGATLTFGVTAGVLSATLPGTVGLVSNGEELEVPGGSVMITVTDGVVSGVYTPD